MNNNKKRALIVAYNGLGNSGVPNLIFQVVKALSNEFYFDILVFDDSNYYYDSLKKLGSRIIKYNETRPSSKLKRIFNYIFQRDKNYYEFTKTLIKENKYEVVHSFKESDSAPFFKAAKDCKVSKIIYHCTVIQDGPKKPIERFIFKKKMRKCLRLSNIRIGVSRKCCEIAFKKRKSCVLHNSYNEKSYYFKEIKPIAGIKLFHISSFSDNKNQMFSAQVLNELKKLDVPCNLVFVGDSGDQDYKKKVILYANENGLNDDIIFAKSDQIKDIIDDISFYILPSKKEGASIVVIEAQAQGFTVFASDTLSPDMNVGGCTFLDLKKGPSYWANKIYDYYNKNGSKRVKYNMGSFSSKHFENDLKTIYQINN